MDPLVELEALLDRWRREVFGNSSADPVPVLTGISELIERETEEYLKLPIDPFDDRHPSRAYPECTLGHLLKALFDVEDFMGQLTTDFIASRGSFELHVAACRLLLDILPGLDSAAVFKEAESSRTLVTQLLHWAENAEFPLHSYATGLLSAAMYVDEVPYREQTNRLVPVMLNRLNQLTNINSSTNSTEHNCDNNQPHSSRDETEERRTKRPRLELEFDESQLQNECSSSSWAEAYMSGSYQMHPLSKVMQQRFILQYLSALGSTEYLLVHMFEHKALSYILHFIDKRKNQDIRLAFDALKFLASLLRHKKFALEFLDHNGLLQLLRVERQGMASSGVSLCLYWLAYNEDVMEKICWMEKRIVESMISYGLWLLEGSHDSSRADAAMFFGLCFQFPLLLKLFDRGDGLRKMLNVVLTRSIFFDDPTVQDVTDDELFARRQTARQVCIALKKYTRAHFIVETRKDNKTNGPAYDQDCKPIGITDDSFMAALEAYRQQSTHRYNWKASDKLSEDGINYLLKLIAHTINEGISSPTKSDTVRNALEALVVCSLSPKVQQLLLSETISTTRTYRALPITMPAIAVIVMCADPKIPDCNKSALNILINLVCSNQQTRVPPPSLNVSIESTSAPGSGRKRNQSRNYTDQAHALRKAVWSNNGTLILPELLKVTSPLTSADLIRSLACRVLCGLAKDESIRQIMSKLPLFNDGNLQTLVKEPILQEKKLEHASFVKYCKELVHLVTGTPVANTSSIEPSMGEINRQRIVAQTKINFDKTEAYHLIYNYLNSQGFPDIAAAFYDKANLSTKPIKELSLMMQKSMLQPSQHFKKLTEPATPPVITLESIFQDYLRHQHSLCLNPVATCPPFRLLEPHRCPEPTNRFTAPVNIASRIIMRKIHPPRGGIYGAKYDRHYVYSKFRPFRLVRDPALEFRSGSTCCAFSKDGQLLFVGTDGGMLKAYNISSGTVEASYDCHTNELGYIEASCDDNLILTTSPESPAPQCCLWTFTDIFERKQRFDQDLHAEFSKASSDRIISTGEEYARLWDTATGSHLRTFNNHHRYTCNRATFNYNDSLILNDGLLWDTQSPRHLHEFGKFNQRINGIFHPNGNEIICNSQVWDLRNYRLLRTVPAFDMCQLKFNSTGDIIFSTILDDQSDVNMNRANNEFKTSFRTFDSQDYSTISTIDINRTIFDLAISSGDEHIALVESGGNVRCLHDEYIADHNVCRLYEVGRPRYVADIDLAEDDEDADDEENEEDDDDDDDDDDEDEEDGADLDDYDEDYVELYGGSDGSGSSGDEEDEDDDVDEDIGDGAHNGDDDEEASGSLDEILM